MAKQGFWYEHASKMFKERYFVHAIRSSVGIEDAARKIAVQSWTLRKFWNKRQSDEKKAGSNARSNPAN